MYGVGVDVKQGPRYQINPRNKTLGAVSQILVYRAFCFDLWGILMMNATTGDRASSSVGMKGD